MNWLQYCDEQSSINLSYCKRIHYSFYNDDDTFTDFSKKTEGSNNVEYGKKLALNFAYVARKANVDYKISRKGSHKSYSRMINFTMQIECYHSNDREELLTLSDDALTLLDR